MLPNVAVVSGCHSVIKLAWAWAWAHWQNVFRTSGRELICSGCQQAGRSGGSDHMDLKYAPIHSQLLRIAHCKLVCRALHSKIRRFACVFLRILEPYLTRIRPKSVAKYVTKSTHSALHPCIEHTIMCIQYTGGGSTFLGVFCTSGSDICPQVCCQTAARSLKFEYEHKKCFTVMLFTHTYLWHLHMIRHTVADTYTSICHLFIAISMLKTIDRQDRQWFFKHEFPELMRFWCNMIGVNTPLKSISCIEQEPQYW